MFYKTWTITIGALALIFLSGCSSAAVDGRHTAKRPAESKPSTTVRGPTAIVDYRPGMGSWQGGSHASKPNLSLG